MWHKANDNLSFSEVELAWTNYGNNSRHKTHHWGNEKKQHPTQKPLGVIKWSLSLAPDDPQTVIDPYMGIGTTLLAAKIDGRSAIGIEINEEYCRIAVEHLRQKAFAFL